MNFFVFIVVSVMAIHGMPAPKVFNDNHWPTEFQHGEFFEDNKATLI